jgi:Cu(I)/Ag(I) efflux system membrane fusion protein
MRIMKTMKTVGAITLVFAAVMALSGCARREPESPMEGMTAEEHARMQGGGTAGATDTTGAAVRRPIRLTGPQERALGVSYATVERAPVTRTIRTVGTVQAPEPAIAEVTTKVEGFVEALAVTATGEAVRRGQPLVTLYSPALVASQEELLTARRLVMRVDSTAPDAWRNAHAVLEAARRRLAWWDVPADDIAELERTGEVRRTVTLRAPVSGVVLEKMALLGQRVMPGMPLYKVAELSEVWVEGDVFEQDLRFVRLGAEVHIEVSAYPGDHIMGRVSFIYPTLDPVSRTNRVRVAMPNPSQRLKPGMFATVYLDVTLGDVVLVPASAVIATGERNLVFVRDTTGMLIPRSVVVGARSGDRIEIVEGLTPGEQVVRSATFLVDAESRLGGAGTGMPGMQHGPEGGAAGRSGGKTAPPPMPEHRDDTTTAPPEPGHD